MFWPDKLDFTFANFRAYDPIRVNGCQKLKTAFTTTE